MFENIISDAWKSILAGEVISLTYEEIKKILKKYNRRLLSNQDEYKNSFNLVLTDSLNWAGFIQSIGLYNSNNDLLTHFIDMDYYVVPVKYQYKKIESSKSLVEHISSDIEKNLVVFGLPGMGKTTSMKMIAFKIISDSDFLKNYFSIPFIIRLRELKNTFSDNDFKLNSNNLLFIYLFNLLSLRISVLDEEIEKERKNEFSYFSLLRHVVISTLEELKVILILDGFDELESIIRDNIFAQIKELSFKTTNLKILITSRTGEFKYNIENFNYYELAPLTDKQIKIFSKKWLGDKYLQFISTLESSSFLDTAIRPLILSFLCLIYKYNDELPNKPKFIYREIIDLLLERWDKERNIPRKSKFSNFNKNQKLEFIADLAFLLAIDSKYFFTKHDIQIAYVEIAENYELDKHNYQDIIDEIEEHSGIFIQSGVDSYEFPHKSIQEFLAAEYLVRYTPISKFSSEFDKIPNELAIAISLCRNPNNYLIEVLTGLLTTNPYEFDKFLNTFMARLISEKPVFKVSEEFAIEICKLIKVFQDKNYKNYEFFKSLFSIKGIKESFDLLDLKYSCEPDLIHNLIKGKSYNENELIEISENKTLIKYICYFKFVMHWRYVKPYLKFNEKN